MRTYNDLQVPHQSMRAFSFHGEQIITAPQMAVSSSVNLNPMPAGGKISIRVHLMEFSAKLRKPSLSRVQGHVNQILFCPHHLARTVHSTQGPHSTPVICQSCPQVQDQTPAIFWEAPILLHTMTQMATNFLQECQKAQLGQWGPFPI